MKENNSYFENSRQIEGSETDFSADKIQIYL